MKFYKYGAVVFLALFVCLPAAAQDVRTEAGKIQLGAAVKWLWGYSQRDSETAWPGRDDFTTSLVDVTLDGVLADNLSYNVELAATYSSETQAGGLAGRPNPGEVGTIGVRQVSMTFSKIVPWTDVKLGTFIPNITNYMPRRVNDMDLIQYPLLNNGSRMTTALFGNMPVARDLSTWQNAGVNITVTPPYMVQLDVGFWNGIMPGGMAQNDQNVANATSVIFTFSPNDELSVSAAYWGEDYDQGYPSTGDVELRTLTLWYMYGSYSANNLEVTADYATGIIADGQLDVNGEYADVGWYGWQVTVGYWLMPELELLARYEELDPDSKDGPTVPTSLNDKANWLTLGANWRFAQGAELSLNYVFKQEDANDISVGSPAADPSAPGYNPQFAAQDNDLLLIQVQVWQ